MEWLPWICYQRRKWRQSNMLRKVWAVFSGILRIVFWLNFFNWTNHKCCLLLKVYYALHNKYPEKIILLDDKACPHNARVSVNMTRTFAWETLLHPVYSLTWFPHTATYLVLWRNSSEASNMGSWRIFRKQCVTARQLEWMDFYVRVFSNLQNDEKSVYKEMETVLKSDTKICRLSRNQYIYFFNVAHDIQLVEMQPI